MAPTRLTAWIFGCSLLLGLSIIGSRFDASLLSQTEDTSIIGIVINRINHADFASWSKQSLGRLIHGHDRLGAGHLVEELSSEDQNAWIAVSSTDNDRLKTVKRFLNDFQRKRKESGNASISVCGTSESFEYFKTERSCYGFNYEEYGKLMPSSRAPYDIKSCPWPKSSYISQLNHYDDVHNETEFKDELDLTQVLPVPGSKHFINFTVSEARELLRGKTVLITGDSSSRRLFLAFCNFLSGDVNRSVLAEETLQYWPRYCNWPGIAKELDIILTYRGLLELQSVQRVANHFRDVIDMRERGKVTGLADASENLSIQKEDLMETNFTKSVHVFSQGITFHTIPECEMTPGEIENASSTPEMAQRLKDCGYQEFFSKEIEEVLHSYNAQLAASDNGIYQQTRAAQRFKTTCAIAVEMCDKIIHEFVSHKSSLKQSLARSKNGNPADVNENMPIFTHVLSSTPAENSLHGKLYAFSNTFFSLNPAKAGYSIQTRSTNGELNCKEFIPFMDSIEATATEVNDEVTCDYVDQSTWILDGKHWTMEHEYSNIIHPDTNDVSRHKCFMGEGWQGIHIYTEQAQLMRVQTLINAIFYSELRKFGKPL